MPSKEQYEKLEKMFLKIYLIPGSETASSTTEESNFLECVEADAAKLAVDGDSSDCFQSGANEI